MPRYEDFHGRVDYAARFIADGRDNSCARAFDGCFEMHDGDAVATALYRRAQKAPDGRLAQNLWRYIARETCEPVALENAHRTNLAAWAREMRAKAEAKFSAWQAYEEDRRRQPNYHDGTPRKRWHELGEIEQSSWIKNPTPRDHYAHELTDAGEQTVIPGCERNASPKAKQLDLFG